MKQLILLILAVGLVFITSACQLVTVPVLAIESIKGIEVGVPSMPYFAYSKSGLEQLNREMEDAGMPVTIADTYQIAYGKNFNEVNPDILEAPMFYNIKDATHAFQKILRAKNVPDANHYMLTINDSAKDEGLILFAAIFRPRLSINVPATYPPSRFVTLTPEDNDFYAPFQHDTKGPLDTVLEWAALPVESYLRQSHQAVLFTLTANKVLQKKEKPEFWKIEKRWMEGDHLSVVKEQDETYTEFLGLEQGFSDAY
jgi:hypothetical protein